MDNITFWKDIFVSGGQIGGLVVVVVYFLRHLKHRDDQFERVSDKLWTALTANTVATNHLTSELAHLQATKIITFKEKI